MTLSVSSDALNSCSGCEIALLNLGESLLDLLQDYDFLHIPILMDHKYFGQQGEKNKLNIPSADIGLVSGGIKNEEHLSLAREIRKKCRNIIAFGTCATHGGIPALMNRYTNKDLFEEYYSSKSTDPGAKVPDKGVPKLLDRCFALDEHVKVDTYLPGCPPHPDDIKSLFLSFLNKETPESSFRSVCDTCPTIRKGKGDVKQIKRCISAPEFDPDKPVSDMRCLLEQGYLCAGPVTREGCSGVQGEIPRCIHARVPCRGCYGPVRQNGNQRLDMINALASNGIDITSLSDPDSLLRFSGAHNRINCQKRGK